MENKTGLRLDEKHKGKLIEINCYQFSVCFDTIESLTINQLGNILILPLCRAYCTAQVLLYIASTSILFTCACNY